MGRKLLILAGLMLTLLGTVCLVLFGPVLVRVQLVFLGETEFAGLAAQFRWAAAAATVLALGGTLLGFVAQRDSVRLAVSGKGLVSLGGLAMFLGTMAVTFSVVTSYFRLRELAQSAAAPTAGDFTAMVTRAELPAQVGFGLLALSQILCLFAAFGLQSATEKVRGPTVAKMAGVTYMMMGWMMALLFLLIWVQTTTGILDAPDGVLQPVKLLEGVNAVLIQSCLICFCLFLQAACLAAIGFSSLRR